MGTEIDTPGEKAISISDGKSEAREQRENGGESQSEVAETKTERS